MQISNVTTLTTQYYQPALSVAATATSTGLLADRLGLVVTDIEDIDQCIQIILGTPQGSDPHRPTFGANLEQYVDWPLSAARPRIARDVKNALDLWEPRVSLLQVQCQTTDIARLVVSISWQPVVSYSGTPVVTSLAFGKLS